MSRPDPEFRSFQKVKEVQAWAIDLTREKTRAVYVTALWRYWRNYLSKTYSSLWEWIVAVKSAYRSDDNVIRKSWALELKSWMNGYVSEVTKQPLQTSSKNILTSAIQSFLKFYVDDPVRFKWSVIAEDMDLIVQEASITSVQLEGMRARLQGRAPIFLNAPENAAA